MTVRVALIDGPLPETAPASPAERHADALAAALRASGPVELLPFPVFDVALTTSAARVAAALRAAAEARPAVVLCAFGLARPDPEIGAAVAGLAAQGAVVVAAAAARGGKVWPAAFPEAVAVQGDARCDPGDWSWLGLPHADFGACPRCADPGVGGASVAAAHLAGLVAARRAAAQGDPPDALLAAMVRDARFMGRERRTAAEP